MNSRSADVREEPAHISQRVVRSLEEVGLYEVSFRRFPIDPLCAGFWPLSEAQIPGLFRPVLLPPLLSWIGKTFRKGHDAVDLPAAEDGVSPLGMATK